jgi:hypothetical protein
MDDLTKTLLILACVGYLAGMLVAGAYTANEKGRSLGEGAVFGVLFGPLGLLIVACLPTVERKPQPALDDEMTAAALERHLKRAR